MSIESYDIGDDIHEQAGKGGAPARKPRLS